MRELHARVVEQEYEKVWLALQMQCGCRSGVPMRDIRVDREKVLDNALTFCGL